MSQSQTQDSIGIHPDHKPEYAKDGGNNATNYNRDLSGQRKSSKSATYPWTADTPVNAKLAAKTKRVSPPID